MVSEDLHIPKKNVVTGELCCSRKMSIDVQNVIVFLFSTARQLHQKVILQGAHIETLVGGLPIKGSDFLVLRYQPLWPLRPLTFVASATSDLWLS